MKNHISTASEPRPSATRAFFRGAFSGAGSGALMAGIVTVLAPFMAWTGAALSTWSLPAITGAFIGSTMLGALITTAPLLITATALFSGFMAVKNASSHVPAHDHRHTRYRMTIIPAGMTVPVISQNQAASLDTAEPTPAKNWVATTHRAGDSQSRVQQILDQGMSDKDRASAILAARETASEQPSQRLI